MHVDREKAKNYGFSANDVAQYIAIALRGVQLKDFHGDDAQVPVWLRFAGSDAQSVDDLSDYKLRRARRRAGAAAVDGQMRIRKTPHR